MGLVGPLLLLCIEAEISLHHNPFIPVINANGFRTR